MEKWQLERPGVVVPVRLDPAGQKGPTPGQARGPGWRSPAHGWHLPSAVDPTPRDQRIVEAVVCAPDGACATGWAALGWLGGRWFDGLRPDGSPMPVPIALGDRRKARPRDGVELSEDWLFDDDLLRVDGLPLTVPERSATYAARRARHLVAAVQVIDMAAYSDLVDLTRLAAYVDRLAARQGVVQLRKALELAEENSWSPQESRLRLLWREQGLARGPLLCNPPVFDRDGRHLFTPDLLDPVAGVVGEYDGALHLPDAPRRRDLDREELYRRCGLESVTMMAGDAVRPEGWLTRLRGAYRRAAATGRAADRARWTLEQPDWWVDTATVARRRALTDAEREIWLRHRVA